MLFTSLFFPFFFALVFFLYSRAKLRAQNVILLVASYVFYGWWDWRFLSLLLISTVCDYAIALGIEKADCQRKRKWLLLASLAINLGILGFFKYFNFFTENFFRAARFLGWEPGFVTLNILLPVGISFYTFQTLSYTIDVYRNRIKPTRSLLNFAVYVSFFPQLVAGPIERAEHFLPQVESPRVLTARNFRRGMWLVILGYFKKTVVADNCGFFADSVFNGGGVPDTFMLFLAVYAFAFQIYGDFSGYSDIARGLSKVMGFDLMINFRRPYFATNPVSFWRRWHISLSTWLRDYLYIPLGGNRHGEVKTYRNLLVTMLLGGLWHGAQVTFVVWGAFQGVVLMIHRYWTSHFRLPSAPRSFPGKLIQGLVFFHIVCVGWFFFRLNFISGMFQLLGGLGQFHIASLAVVPVLLIYIAPLLVLDAFWELTGKDDDVPQWPPLVLAGVAYLLIAMILVFGNWAGESFIYFQF